MKKNNGDSNEIEELIKQNNFEEVIKKVKNKSKANKPLPGPLNKNQQTKDFEYLVKYILYTALDEIKEQPKLKFSINEDDKKIYVERDGNKTNLSEMLENVNFNHLNFTKRDIENYAKIIKELNPDMNTKEDFRNDIREADQDKSLGVLDYGEMAAINTYTSQEYTKINSLLRGMSDNFTGDLEVEELKEKLKTPLKNKQELTIKKRLNKFQKLKELFLDKEENNSKAIYIPEAMITAAIASHGLNRLPDEKLLNQDSTLPRVIRGEGEFNIQNYTGFAEENKIIQEKAFISTTTNLEVVDGGFANKNEKNLKVIYEGRPKNVKAI
ncbi:MAG: hypothetical protein K9G11_01890, partial [Rickettsiaceae bacterium]|nr:hypothetical protein [Rickettsiaceae bacterium]